jgi:tRNA-dihydrouridine synthase
LSKQSFRKAIFNIVEYFTKYQLSDQAKKLILHYFNEMRHDSSYQRAISSIEKYTQQEIPPYDEAADIMKFMLNKLSEEADSWDKE